MAIRSLPRRAHACYLQGVRISRSLLLVVALPALLGLTACDGDGSADGGLDGAVRDGATRDAARTDAGGAICEPTCPLDLACCDVTGGGTSCVSLRDDIHNCGDCNVDCLATSRGDACTRSVCTCGSSPLGCRGTRQDFCCMPTGSTPYCANLDQDADNCGDCGVVCDGAVGNRCDGGECRCGDTRAPCLGTEESTCCVSGADVGCVDLRTDQFHCGRCNNLCLGFERCEESTCHRGPETCAGGCGGDDEICCRGQCCTREACMMGTCGGPASDAGTPADAGTPTDAGPADAGPDAG